MPAHKESGSKNDELVKELQNLMTLPGNDICADCPTTNPDWASVNLGIFICMKCSGIHRNLGTHISKVRSVEMDRWNDVQVERIKDIGNARSNQFWEQNVPLEWEKSSIQVNFKSSTASDRRRDFIIQKYHDRAFMSVHDDPDL